MSVEEEEEKDETRSHDFRLSHLRRALTMRQDEIWGEEEESFVCEAKAKNTFSLLCISLLAKDERCSKGKLHKLS
jgi:hypothetical protein